LFLWFIFCQSCIKIVAGNVKLNLPSLDFSRFAINVSFGQPDVKPEALALPLPG
jgi:hypothetical protein